MANLSRKKKVVGEKFYPDDLIKCCLCLRAQFHLPLRQADGFVRSLMRLWALTDVPTPDYTTLSRRAVDLPVEIRRRLAATKENEKLYLVIDSTGLKVFGEGEWKVRQHGWSKHRRWRKLHLALNPATQEIVAMELTGNDEDDATVGARMLRGKLDNVRACAGDGAYDHYKFRAVLGAEVQQRIPPPRNAVAPPAAPPCLRPRNEAVKFI